MNIISKESFATEVQNTAYQMIKDYPCIRWGQAVFNVIDDLGFAREVQFKHGVDCFFRDDLVDAFIEESYKAYCEINKSK